MAVAPPLRGGDAESVRRPDACIAGTLAAGLRDSTARRRTLAACRTFDLCPALFQHLQGIARGHRCTIIVLRSIAQTSALRFEALRAHPSDQASREEKL